MQMRFGHFIFIFYIINFKCHIHTGILSNRLIYLLILLITLFGKLFKPFSNFLSPIFLCLCLLLNSQHIKFLFKYFLFLFKLLLYFFYFFLLCFYLLLNFY